MAPYVMNSRGSAFDRLSDWLRAHAILASAIVMVCSISPRLLLAWRADPDNVLKLNPDIHSYRTLALSLLEDGAFLNKGKKPEVTRTPGYPTFLAALMLVVGRDLHRLMLAQAIILSASVVILYLLARLILPPVTAFIAGWIAAFSPWGAVFAVLPITDGLFLLLLASIFFFMKLAEGAKSVRALLFGGASVGLLTGAAVMVRPALPLLVLVPATLFVLYGLKRKGAVALLAVATVFAGGPVLAWKYRNQQVGQFVGFTDLTGRGVWHYLASRVIAQANNRDQDRVAILRSAFSESERWELSAQKADDERWRRAMAVFRDHPFLTVYCIFLSAAEHALHPSPGVLSSVRLNFAGDFWVLGLFWTGLLVLAVIGWVSPSDPGSDNGVTDRAWLLALLAICSSLTLAGGIVFGQGARYRLSLELIVPLLAAAGLVRTMRGSSQRLRKGPSPRSTAMGS